MTIRRLIYFSDRAAGLLGTISSSTVNAAIEKAYGAPAPAQDERKAFNAEYDRICNRPLTMREIAWRMWQARATRPAQTEQHPSTTQQILDLILEQCRYWHGRDEARRGGFACLYAQAKEIADNAAPIAQTEQQPLFFINPLVIDELKGKRKPSPGGLTWSRTACGHWTFAVYAAPIAQTAQGAGDASA